MPEGGMIKLPLVGEVKKKTAYIGGAVILGIVGIAYYRSKKAKQALAAASGDTGQVTDPAGNVCGALNPQSGYCPGSPEDTQYLQQQSAGLGATGIGYPGFQPGYPGAGYGSFVTDAQGNTCTAIDPATGLCPVGSTGGTTGRTSVTTNAQWAQEALLLLGNTDTVKQAIGYALEGHSVTADQKNLFQEAIGLLGQPPQGYPPLNVIGQPTGTHPAPHPGKVKVPRVVGMRATPALEEIRAAGFKSHTVPVRDPRHEYVVAWQVPGGGSEATKGSSVVLGIRLLRSVNGRAPTVFPGAPMVTA